MIFAIDPGTMESAFVLYDPRKKKVIDAAKRSNSFLMDVVFPRIREGYSPDHIVVEMIASYGMSVGQEVFQTCVWVGRFVEHWLQYPVTVDTLYRKEAKLHLCGSTNANDSNVRQSLIDKFGKPGTKKDINPNYPIVYKPRFNNRLAKDEWAALAVAVAWAETKLK